ncbi:hypothetical protein FEM03_17400 [Phragmitibacter flavus]|uniref:Uncharacterized protein n=1 Tax=Phragmitibacter flavus TaxID=2576071 RepID=A0A5R8KAT0_9BACT|nr:hypothetical protein FEM03_17400 [Phragmitibacter flavus]
MSVAVLMRKRVSSRRLVAGSPRVVLMSKCLTQTMPVGKVHGVSGEKVMVSVRLRMANQRDLVAWSLQKSTLGA